MKKTAITILLACALLGAGCSDSDETTAVATPTPIPELTAEQLAVIQAEDKAAVKRKMEANGMTPPPDATVVSSPSPTPTAAQVKS